jgi:hypothetical protein
MALYHFSETPDITVFHPHVAKTSAIRDEAFVWAIDDWHAPMYFVPRDCPRACFWAGPKTTQEDRDPIALESHFTAGGVITVEVRGWRITRLENRVVWRTGSGFVQMLATGRGSEARNDS